MEHVVLTVTPAERFWSLGGWRDAESEDEV